MSEKELIPQIELPLPHIWVCCVCEQAHANKNMYGALDVEYTILAQFVKTTAVCYCCSHCSKINSPSDINHFLKEFKRKRTTKQTNYLTEKEFEDIFIYGV